MPVELDGCNGCDLSYEFTYELLNDCWVSLHAVDEGVGDDLAYTWTVNGHNGYIHYDQDTIIPVGPYTQIQLHVADYLGCEGDSEVLTLVLPECVSDSCDYEVDFSYEVENCLLTFSPELNSSDSTFTYVWLFDGELSDSLAAEDGHLSHLFLGENPHSATLIVIDNETGCSALHTETFDLDCEDIDCSYLDAGIDYEVFDDCYARCFLADTTMTGYLTWLSSGNPSYSYDKTAVFHFGQTDPYVISRLYDPTTGCYTSDTITLEMPDCHCPFEGFDFDVDYEVTGDCEVDFHAYAADSSLIGDFTWVMEGNIFYGPDVSYSFTSQSHPVLVIMSGNPTYPNCSDTMRVLFNLPDCECNLDGSFFSTVSGCQANFVANASNEQGNLIFDWYVDFLLKGHGSTYQEQFAAYSVHTINLVVHDTITSCVTESVQFVDIADCTLGVDDKTPNILSFYPVPAKNTLHVTSTAEIADYEIFTITGQKAMVGKAEKKAFDFDVSGLTAGVYIFVTEINGEPAFFRFLKE